jgi:hypothetical protein
MYGIKGGILNGEMTLKEPLPLLKSIRVYNMPRLSCCMDDNTVKFRDELK